MKVKDSSDTPAGTNQLMGATDRYLGVFTFCAGVFEAVQVQEVVVSWRFLGENALHIPINVRLVDMASGKPIGNAVAQFGTMVHGQDTKANLPEYGHAVFEGLTYKLPKGICMDIGVLTDFVTYEAGGFTTTGQHGVLGILGSYTNTPNKDVAVKAVGLTSGLAITPTVISNWPKVPGAYVSASIFHRTKLITSWAADTPMGVAAPGGAQVVGKFVVTNLANSGNYPSTMESLNVDLMSTLKPLTMPRVFIIYKDSLVTTPIATYTFKPGEVFAATAIKQANFTSVVFASGTSKTFYVTLDTSEAKGGDSLQVRVNGGGIRWSDGVSQGIAYMYGYLPLDWKSFIY
ncbi:MAG: hypothetical protein EXS55_03405 [Candidatus Magasanikbacteria bacterium]|nr:hypothetical protein [Candidatus Magasanikbacteria bacterium]